MNNWQLIAPYDTAPLIAELFNANSCCRISAQEDEAFQDGWLPLGDVSIQSAGQSHISANHVTCGAFEWRLPSVKQAQSELAKLLGYKDEQRAPDKVARAMDSISSIGVRTGLVHPRFDPISLEQMPFRSTTIVVDTSAVLQGALNFVSRYLHAAARIKVPAIVQMELVNSYDRFRALRSRKKTKNENSRTEELIEHLKSQGGQRVLIRLELGTDTEIERTYLLGDPLRSAFQPDNDNAVSGLGLSKVIQAYADRLILEAARHHQAQTDPGHIVRLLTADQGLARMALAEGIKPLYFSAEKSSDFFGERLSGQTLHPLTGDICRISLVTVMWELATAFGAARLDADNERFMEIRAFGKEVSWWPYHSKDDLLWYRQVSVLDSDIAPSPTSPALPVSAGQSESSLSAAGSPMTTQPDLLSHKSNSPPQPSKTSVRVSYARFGVGRMFELICLFDNEQVMSESRIKEILKARGPRGAEEYFKFLVGANFISLSSEGWVAEPLLRQMSAALRNERVEEVKTLLTHSMSFAAFVERVASHGIGQPLDFSGMTRGKNTYRTLGELMLLCAASEGKVYATPCEPDARSFARIAYERFIEVSKGEYLAATGAWLELLIRADGIHPEVARARLEEARREGFLHRYTEGSTTQVRFDDRIVHVLRSQSGMPVVQPVHLYRGDYLIPGKGSVSLRIEESDI